MTPDSARMPLMSHHVELRSRIIKSVVAVAVGTVVGFFFYRDVLELLAKPYEHLSGRQGFFPALLGVIRHSAL